MSTSINFSSYHNPIYSNFKKEVSWIANRHRTEFKTFPKSLQNLADYYLKKRLLILTKKSDVQLIDARIGRPMPYAAFWFADAFGFKGNKNDNITRDIALTLSYISIVVSVRDDLIDNKIASEHEHVSLTNLYYDKYFTIFKNLFSPKSTFWYILSNSLNEWSKYETWDFVFDFDQIKSRKNFDPLSKEFLTESSGYLPMLMLPSIAALALLSNNESKIKNIERFLYNYWMGWRIVDDLRDWQKDLKIKNYNHSSVLYYAIKQIDGDFQNVQNIKINENEVLSVLLDKSSINDIYGTIIRYFTLAKKNILNYDSDYLTNFMEQQIQFHTDEKNSMINLNKKITTG